MAAVAGGVYYGLYALLAKTALHAQLVNVLCLGVAVVLAVTIYFVVYLMVADLSDEEIAMIPGGRILKRLARRLPALGR